MISYRIASERPVLARSSARALAGLRRAATLLNWNTVNNIMGNLRCFMRSST